MLKYSSASLLADVDDPLSAPNSIDSSVNISVWGIPLKEFICKDCFPSVSIKKGFIPKFDLPCKCKMQLIR